METTKRTVCVCKSFIVWVWAEYIFIGCVSTWFNWFIQTNENNLKKKLFYYCLPLVLYLNLLLVFCSIFNFNSYGFICVHKVLIMQRKNRYWLISWWLFPPVHPWTQSSWLWQCPIWVECHLLAGGEHVTSHFHTSGLGMWTTRWEERRHRRHGSGLFLIQFPHVETF